MSDPLSPEFDVVVDGETYTFRKPNIRYRIEIGYKAADVRMRAYPAAQGALHFGVDRAAVEMSRAMAIMELYLVRSDQQWPFSPGTDGKPTVDFDKFPADREETVLEICLYDKNSFEAQIARFRERRNPDKSPDSSQAVDSQPNPG